jgi:glycosyltransferase involved in cell wall biosynthesis
MNTIVTRPSIVLVRGASTDRPVREDWEAAPFHEIQAEILHSGIWKYLFRFREVEMHTNHIEAVMKPLLCAILLRLMSRGRCYFTDDYENQKEITLPAIARIAVGCLYDWIRIPRFLQGYRRDVRRLATANARRQVELDLDRRPIYLRTDLCFGLRSGGWVGHIAGVLNCLDQFTGKPVFLTTDRIPTVSESIESHCLLPERSFLSFAELRELYFNKAFEAQAKQILADVKPAFFYQRYSLNNFCGIKLSRQCGVPFVLEYNGSEVWLSRNWGKPLKHEDVARENELLNVTSADLVVVVSEPMRQDLIDLGVDAERVLVNPNGVNPEVYAPSVDGSEVRRRYGLEGCTVIGFIGTFGKWHGAEVLAEAFGRLLREHPRYRDIVRLLLIGDGVMMPEVKRRLATAQVQQECILTGTVRQKEGPEHLAACDLLASPHVPNADGTRFFGSPTKLFEYMAMGKGIVASDLDQIGDVLAHGRSAWMVEPGNIDSLTEGLRTLIEDAQLRERLGREARREVVANFTWREHTRRIIEALKTLTATGSLSGRNAA